MNEREERLVSSLKALGFTKIPFEEMFEKLAKSNPLAMQDVHTDTVLILNDGVMFYNVTICMKDTPTIQVVI